MQPAKSNHIKPSNQPPTTPLKQKSSMEGRGVETPIDQDLVATIKTQFEQAVKFKGREQGKVALDMARAAIKQLPSDSEVRKLYEQSLYELEIGDIKEMQPIWNAIEQSLKEQNWIRCFTLLNALEGKIGKIQELADSPKATSAEKDALLKLKAEQESKKQAIIEKIQESEIGRTNNQLLMALDAKSKDNTLGTINASPDSYRNLMIAIILRIQNLPKTVKDERVAQEKEAFIWGVMGTILANPKALNIDPAQLLDDAITHLSSNQLVDEVTKESLVDMLAKHLVAEMQANPQPAPGRTQFMRNVLNKYSDFMDSLDVPNLAKLKGLLEKAESKQD